MTESTISNHWGVAAPYRYFHKPSVTELISYCVTKQFIEQLGLHRVSQLFLTTSDTLHTARTTLHSTKSIPHHPSSHQNGSMYARVCSVFGIATHCRLSGLRHYI